MKVYWFVFVLAACLLSQCNSVFGQRYLIWQEKPGTWLLNAGVGITRYAGDMNEMGNLAHLKLGAALSVAAAYRISYQLTFRGEAQLYYIHGSQRHTHLAYNNLSFHSRNPDVWVGLQADLWPIDHRTRYLIPYGFLGAGVTYLTPKATYKGKSYSLAPLQTEGISYNRWSGIIRYGFGLPLLTGERFKLHIEGSYTHVMSDYLDDVSSKYPDLKAMDPLAAALSDRRHELGTTPNSYGDQRGNVGKHDGYFIISARVIHTLITRSQRSYRRSIGR